MKNFRRKPEELLIITTWNDKNSKKTLLDEEQKRVKAIIDLCDFFRLYDVIENTHHLSLIKKLYLEKYSSEKYIFDFINELFLSVSSINRAREKYVKAFNYILYHFSSVNDCSNFEQSLII